MGGRRADGSCCVAIRSGYGRLEATSRGLSGSVGLVPCGSVCLSVGAVGCGGSRQWAAWRVMDDAGAVPIALAVDVAIATTKPTDVTYSNT